MIQTKEELFLVDLGINTKEEIEAGYGAKIKITDLLSKYLAAINHTRCCEMLPSFLYEDDGKIYTGVRGDADITEDWEKYIGAKNNTD